MESNIWLFLALLFIADFSSCWCRSIDPNFEPAGASSGQSNSFRPDLGCILFGEAGCSISCNVMCDMYGCYNFDPMCIDEISCECNETYEISSSVMTTLDYNRLSFNKLWNHKITKTKTSQKIRKKIFQYPETFDEILRILRDPHKTGLHVKRRLQDLQPNWPNVLKLEPRQWGYVDNLIEGEQLDEERLEQYLEKNMEPWVDKMQDQMQEMKYKLNLGNTRDQIGDDDEVKQMMTMLAKTLNKKSKSGTVTVYDTDQVILAGVMKKLLDIAKDDQTESMSRTGAEKKFSLSEEMIVGQDDLFDADFNVSEDAGTDNSFVLSDEMTVGKDDLYDAEFGRSIENSESKSRGGREYHTEKSSANYQYQFNQPPNPIVYNNNNNNNNGDGGYNNNNNNINNNGFYAPYYQYQDYYGSAQGNSYFKDLPPPPPNFFAGSYSQSNKVDSRYEENYTELSDYQMDDYDDAEQTNSYTNVCCEGYSSNWSYEYENNSD